MSGVNRDGAVGRQPGQHRGTKSSFELAAFHDSQEQVEERRPFLLGQLRERGGKNACGDRPAGPENLSARRRQVVLEPPAASGAARDQVLGGEPVGERSKRLIALKRLDRQGVGGGARVPVNGAQRIPLGKRRPYSGEPRVERTMVPVLNLLDGSAQGFQIGGHETSIHLSKLAYINILI